MSLCRLKFAVPFREWVIWLLCRYRYCVILLSLPTYISVDPLPSALSMWLAVPFRAWVVLLLSWYASGGSTFTATTSPAVSWLSSAGPAFSSRYQPKMVFLFCRVKIRKCLCLFCFYCHLTIKYANDHFFSCIVFSWYWSISLYPASEKNKNKQHQSYQLLTHSFPCGKWNFPMFAMTWSVIISWKGGNFNAILLLKHLMYDFGIISLKNNPLLLHFIPPCTVVVKRRLLCSALYFKEFLWLHEVFKLRQHTLNSPSCG